MERYLCIHSHFYQPPRENPWLEEVEVQDSAAPYHDWNERITAECYAPNGASRILNREGRIAKVVNNYSRISFNFGPTLLSWMEKHARRAYARILEADVESMKKFSGHGSAMAQAYNHMILPLAGRREKRTQMLWGIRDFRHRFGRDPEGMWLPETAVDMESLELLAESGIRFTVLAQHQARQIRLRQARQWHSVDGARIDPTRGYYCQTRAGKIALFFYDGPVSRAVAFEKLLADGAEFAGRLMDGFDDTRKWPQLMHIATDGETYGHHHAHGDMALAYALDYIESNGLARLTNYGEYLKKHPPTVEAEIHDNTSWSCIHGIGRWAEDCGCNSGGNPGWNQSWRKPLREALDWLRDEAAPLYQENARALLKDPAKALDAYIDVILDRSPASVDRFFAQQASRPLTLQEQVRALKLLELQRYLMLMYTSCGWFFDEITGIETVQVIQYAGRALELGSELFGVPWEAPFVERLANAPSNVPGFGSGADVYFRYVKPAMVDLVRMGAHYALKSLFSQFPERSRLYLYTVERLDFRQFESEHTRLILCRARIISRATREQSCVILGAAHFGGHSVCAGVRPDPGEEAYERLVNEADHAFADLDFVFLARFLDRSFDGAPFSLKSLFRDEQRKASQKILRSVLAEVDASYRQLHERHAPLLRFLSETHQPVPRVLSMTAEFVMNSKLRRALQQPEPDLDQFRLLLEAVQRQGTNLDSAALEFLLRRRIIRTLNWFREEPLSLDRLRKAQGVVALARSMPFTVNLWRAQNIYYDLNLQLAEDVSASRPDERPGADDWADLFASMGDMLGVEVGNTVLQPVPDAG